MSMHMCVSLLILLGVLWCLCNFIKLTITWTFQLVLYYEVVYQKAGKSIQSGEPKRSPKERARIPRVSFKNPYLRHPDFPSPCL